MIALHYGPSSTTPRLSVPAGAGAHPKGKKTKATHGSAPYEPQFQWLPIFVVGSLVVGIGGAMVLMALRRQRELLAATPMRETLEEVLTETLDDLRREPDPRKAVIAAYSNMERTLAARGVPRHESEAPDEYLARILDVVGASGHSVTQADEALRAGALSVLTRSTAR